MELDPRIILLTDIITCFDTDSEKARKTIGKKGYFSFRLGNFYDLSMCDYGTLDLIDTANRDDDHGSDDVFHQKENDCYYSFFIPECFVKPKEKQYRALTIDEFIDRFHIGEVIVVRSKATPNIVYHVLFVGYLENGKNEMNIIFGQYRFSLQELFQSYEHFYNGRWFPFEVEVEE